MSHVWFLVKQYFFWIPKRLPVQTRQDGAFLLVVPDLRPELTFLNEPAAYILKQCDGKNSVLKILTNYMTKFLRADRDQAGWELLKALRLLEAKYIITFEISDN